MAVLQEVFHISESWQWFVVQGSTELFLLLFILLMLYILLLQIIYLVHQEQQAMVVSANVQAHATQCSN